jgi:hypothetical protein
MVRNVRLRKLRVRAAQTRPGQGKMGSKRQGFEPFFVLGTEVEQSVVTRRLAREVESDEAVEGFVGRVNWEPVLK